MHFPTGTTFYMLCISCVTCSVITTDDSLKWPSRELELLDEIHDAELLKAVQQSMRDWEIKSHKHHRKKRAAKKVCYGELGCFEDSGPFSYLEMLPSPPEEINTKFYFYSTKNRSEDPLLELPFLNMSSAFEGFSTNFSSEHENDTTAPFTKASYRLKDMDGFSQLSTRVIVHGFGSACPHVWIYEMKTALMAVENCTVICVDWENGATFPNYVRAAANTRLVGKQLAMLLMNLKKHKGLDLAKTHIIGFSLGAHVAGFAGADLPGLNRITGLDPAGPLFESQHPKVRLDNTDASFVDVIHSNGENLILGGLGSWQPMGHVDFYPNGGRVQTGCSNLFVGAVTDFIWSQAAEIEGRSLCNHRRAYKFFIDSVAPRCIFPAFPCDSYENFLQGKCFPCVKEDGDGENSKEAAHCGNMGYYANKSTGRGQLYLVTREEEPFCAHQFMLEIHNSFNELPLRTIGKLEATLEGESGLNETFLITEKEDAEFFAGDIVSKIIVPHPALGFPTSLTLEYKSYSGWLAKGLPHWDVNKIVLTDSFGRSHSLCKSMPLSSGSPVYLNLEPGLCEIIEGDSIDLIAKESSSSFITQRVQDRQDEVDGVESAKYKKDILNLGSNIKIQENQSYDEIDFHKNFNNWQISLEGNSLDRETSGSSRSYQNGSPEIFEPVLKADRNRINKARNIHYLSDEEIVEPILKSTTPKIRKVKEIAPAEIQEQKSKSEETGAVTVQLFPFRLGELLERAERYARETLLPLISAKAPKIFGFGTTKNTTERKPRYIPRYEFAYNESEKEDLSKLSEVVDNSFADTKKSKNLLELMRNLDNPKNLKEQSSPKITYYSNKLDNSWQFDSASTDTPIPSKDLKDIRIDLPTYKSPIHNSEEEQLANKTSN